ncbi:MAG TPA: hypothetical protein VK487_05940 [Candidatus Bathyarchaeia archaeon]|nr:hypothetical protein [Candidatus Bathyarchaeia archaeon]
MFEDYLEDSFHFVSAAVKQTNEREAKRYYRASVFCAINALEAFTNYIGDAFAQSASLEAYEIAFLTDKKFEPVGGEFKTTEVAEYQRLEDKLRFLIGKFVPSFDFETMPCWSRLIEFKKFRDSLTHPRQDGDETTVGEYKAKIRLGMSSIIEIINHLCKGIFKRPLRKKLLELKI